jgi:hypothetical protein
MRALGEFGALGLPPATLAELFEMEKSRARARSKRWLVVSKLSSKAPQRHQTRPTARRWFFQFERLPRFGHSLTGAAFEAGVFDRKKSCA